MPAWVIGGATLGAGLLGYKGAGDAADAQAAAAGAAGAEEGRQFDLQWNAQAPYRTAGENALAKMALLTGSPDPRAEAMDRRELELANKFLSETRHTQYFADHVAPMFGKSPETVTPQEIMTYMRGDMAPDWNIKYGSARGELMEMDRKRDELGAQASQSIEEMVKQDPSYQFRFDEGQNALENYMSGGGSRWSGNALRAISDYGQDTASQEYGNIFGRQSTIAGYGPGASVTPQNNISGYMADVGNVRANEIANKTNAINTGITNWISYDQNRRMLNAMGPTTYQTDYGIPMTSTDYNLPRT